MAAKRTALVCCDCLGSFLKKKKKTKLNYSILYINNVKCTSIVPVTMFYQTMTHWRHRNVKLSNRKHKSQHFTYIIRPKIIQGRAQQNVLNQWKKYLARLKSLCEAFKPRDMFKVHFNIIKTSHNILNFIIATTAAHYMLCCNVYGSGNWLWRLHFLQWCLENSLRLWSERKCLFIVLFRTKLCYIFLSGHLCFIMTINSTKYFQCLIVLYKSSNCTRQKRFTNKNVR